MFVECSADGRFLQYSLLSQNLSIDPHVGSIVAVDNGAFHYYPVFDLNQQALDFQRQPKMSQFLAPQIVFLKDGTDTSQGLGQLSKYYCSTSKAFLLFPPSKFESNCSLQFPTSMHVLRWLIFSEQHSGLEEWIS